MNISVKEIVHFEIQGNKPSSLIIQISSKQKTSAGQGTKITTNMFFHNKWKWLCIFIIISLFVYKYKMKLKMIKLIHQLVLSLLCFQHCWLLCSHLLLKDLKKRDALYCSLKQINIFVNQIITFDLLLLQMNDELYNLGKCRPKYGPEALRGRTIFFSLAFSYFWSSK